METSGEGPSRRQFLSLAGAVAALASSVACTKVDRGSIVPYTKRPVEVIPGVANYYASSFAEGRRVYSVLVKTREGRPIHLSGNDENPHSRGKTSPRAMADLLRLYDPDRIRQSLIGGKPASFPDAAKHVIEALQRAVSRGKEVLLLTGAVTSPSCRTAISEIARLVPGLLHIEWEPAAGLGEQTATIASYGKPMAIRPKLEKANVVVSLGADFLSGSDPLAISGFSSRRRPSSAAESMNRLWAFEGGMTLTGAAADHRITLRPSRIAATGFALARALAETGRFALPAGLPAQSLPLPPSGVPPGLWKALVADLAAAGPSSLVLGGAELPPPVHFGVLLLNEMLAGRGSTFTLVPQPKLAGPQEISSLLQKMSSGHFDVALFWGVNPAYNLGQKSGFEVALAGVPLPVSIADLPDETTALARVVIAENHWLESWGDHDSGEGVFALQQPAVGPLYDTVQGEEALLTLANGLGARISTDPYEYIKGRWREDMSPQGSPVPFERFFEAALHDGFVMRPAPAENPVFDSRAALEAQRLPSENALQPGFELLLFPSASVHDGRYSNNAWLQELPDPVTKVTWANPVSISVTDAATLEITDGDTIRISAGEAHLEVPAVRQPGQAPGVLSLPLGYGHSTGSVAAGVGVNAYPLVDSQGHWAFLRSGVQISKVGSRSALPVTQGHHRMEGRDIIRTLTLTEYARHASEPVHREELASLYPEQHFGEQKWGMAIDLSACVGCSACVIACQSENNVPVVGPEQVIRGREMHWIRIDRYFEGEPENPRVSHQPMLCQQCDNAPCENVCPVAATTHSDDGLNQMVYNRCVGTRYCANNCPYKVRRFNFLEFTAAKTEPESLVFNPEVTVRPRGVMEKCTFCVQRISDVRVRAKGENRSIRDGEVVPACGAACPAEAIVLGDLKDPQSRVAQLVRSDRGYKVLEDLGVLPAITYLAGLKNPVSGGSRES